jgi:hypothetical protein
VMLTTIGCLHQTGALRVLSPSAKHKAHLARRFSIGKSQNNN